MLKLSTILGSLFYLLPIYIFLIAPALRQFFPPAEEDLTFDPDDDAADLEGPILNGTILSLDDGIEPTCPPDNYRVHLLRRDPLPRNLHPFHYLRRHNRKSRPHARLSDRALLPRTNTVRCLENRAKAFQGWRPHLYIERMWAQRYNASGHYRHHYDWAGSSARGGDRASTFMVYLGDECTGGGTNFPRFKRPRDEKWCRFVECENEAEGVTFRPVKGNAIFWENLRPDGSGYLETWHAAFPVTGGTKVGLNIWSWYQPPRRRRV
ncbi:oxidoreductase [Aspergillus arachidicola]|uniref:Oxidoreductase n=1 Tax=Aspergillus arachidicola TaxID=656916 RepID=A0A2G7G0A2_9EURO|nr:oxidoreductase [Aspergillus arachidicola]